MYYYFWFEEQIKAKCHTKNETIQQIFTVLFPLSSSRKGSFDKSQLSQLNQYITHRNSITFFLYSSNCNYIRHSSDSLLQSYNMADVALVIHIYIQYIYVLFFNTYLSEKSCNSKNIKKITSDQKSLMLKSQLISQKVITYYSDKHNLIQICSFICNARIQCTSAK